MSNRRVKSLDYDDDDFDYDEEEEEEYEEQSELTPEDKEQLRIGTVEVRKVLGPGYQLNNKEIQDSLWNYYYDVQKTVNHLKSEHHIPPFEETCSRQSDKHKPKSSSVKTANRE